MIRHRNRYTLPMRPVQVKRVCDIEVDAGAIAWQDGEKPSVWASKAEGAVVGQLGKLRPIDRKSVV